MKVKLKSIFMIFLIVTISFYISIFSSEDISAAIGACCEKTKSGDSCIYTNEENCDGSYGISYSSCETTNYCQLGCCKVGGECNKKTPYSTCLEKNGTFMEGEDCNLQECSKGCCTLSSECLFTTEEKCSIETSKYEGLELNYDSNINSEFDCSLKCKQQDTGCCFIEDQNCKFTTRSDCYSLTYDENSFYKDIFCSALTNDKNCGCESQFKKGCLEGENDVYWFDSCGNPESIAEGCDYDAGTKCKVTEGEAKCASINCETTYDNPHVDYDGIPRKNGESWCEYDGRVGSGLDLIGSRHYRHICIDGEELVEPCKDFREEFCSQKEVITDNGVYSEAVCQLNKWQECTSTCNSAKIDNADGGYEKNSQKDKACCDDLEKTCIWSGGKNGKCAPLVPPGFAHWEDAGSETCNRADQTCTVYFLKKKKGGSCKKTNKCVGNCVCLTDKWVKGTNAYCRAQGDCGAHYNVAGELTTEGYWEDSPGGPIQKLVGTPEEWLNAGKGLFFGEMDSEDFGEEQGGPLSSLFSPTRMALSASAIALGTMATSMAASAGLAVTGGVSLGGLTLGVPTLSSIGPLFSVGPMAGILGVMSIALFVVGLLYLAYNLLFGECGVWEKDYHADCEVWQAPASGSNCGLCDDNPYIECSEYRCKSLGQTCEIINVGTGNESCVDAGCSGASSPGISIGKISEGYSYNLISNGFEIKPDVKAFSQISIGIKTNKVSQCKYSEEKNKNYEEMENYFGDVLYKEEHILTTKGLENGKEYKYYVRCQDACGNKNSRDYEIKFAIEKGPDLTPPFIERTYPKNGANIPANIQEMELRIETNEPASCNWDIVSYGYENMKNKFVCEDDEFSFIEAGLDIGETEEGEELVSEEVVLKDDGVYRCITNLYDIKTGVNNPFFIRCKDKSGNVMEESYIYNLQGTNNLEITNIEPKGELKTSDITLKVFTKEGVDNGNAVCYYSNRGYDDTIRFFKTGSKTHEQTQILGEGTYIYYVECEDYAGNKAKATTQFSVKADRKAPVITALYEDSASLIIITDEPSECEYSSQEFVFGSGNSIGSGLEHKAPLGEEKYYVICRDSFGNEGDLIIIYP